MTSARTQYAKMWGTQEVVFMLYEIFTTSKNAALRGTCASALARLGRIFPAMIQQLLEKTDPQVITDYLTDSNPKVQQAFLNLVNEMLLDSSSKIQLTILEDKQLIAM